MISIHTTQVIEIKNIINQKLADTLISEYQLIHYLFALINTPSAHQSNALKWAIFTTKCIELLDNNEHTATVAKLCMRFRLACTKQKHHWFHNFLPSLPLELEDQLIL